MTDNLLFFDFISNSRYLDTESNRIVVRLGECTDEYIAKFKNIVSNSPMIKFIEGGKNIITIPSKKK